MLCLARWLQHYVADGEGVGSLRNAVLRSIVLRLVNGATLEAYDVRQVCLRALITVAIRCHDPSRFAVYTTLASMAPGDSIATGATTAGAHAARKERGRLWPLVSDGEPGFATKRAFVARLCRVEASPSANVAVGSLTESEGDIQPAIRLLDDVYACKAAVVAGKAPPHTRKSLLQRAQLFCHLPPSFDFE